MSEFSSEEIQRAADEVSRGGFGDFMFRGPSRNRRTSSSSRNTTRHSSRHTTRRHTSAKRCTTRRYPTKCFKIKSGWQSSHSSNHQKKCYWDNGNMWKLRVRRR
ncbi:hypothetical protein AA0X95_14065 [Bacillus sp. 1P10SD]|uniref:CotG/ExsB N-terminal domain-containing protein n=1 Tax=Bacillus sp. 1P10SD TaxID=3132265 RepID=UPI0039A70CE6